MPARKNRPDKHGGPAPRPNTGTPAAQVDRWAAETGARLYGHLGPGAFDVVCRGTYACLACDPASGKWSATHNMVPSKGDPLYRHATVGEAFSAYESIGNGARR